MTGALTAIGWAFVASISRWLMRAADDDIGAAVLLRNDIRLLVAWRVFCGAAFVASSVCTAIAILRAAGGGSVQ